MTYSDPPLYMRMLLFETMSSMEFRSYLSLVCKTDIPLSFDTGMRDGRNIGKNVKNKHGIVVVVTGWEGGM